MSTVDLKRGRPPGRAAWREVELLNTLDTYPGLTIQELADFLCWKFSTTRYYLSLVRKDGIVRKVMAARYYLVEEQSVDWYVLSDRKSLCLDCEIPGGCNERDQRCLFRQAEKSPQPVCSESKVLDYLEGNQDTWFRIIDLSRAVSTSYSTITKTVRRLRTQGRIEHKGEKHTLRLRAIKE